MRNTDKTSKPDMPRAARTKGAGPGPAAPANPRNVAQGIAERIAERTPSDRAKLLRSSRRAVEAADRLIEDMDEVLKRLARKG